MIEDTLKHPKAQQPATPVHLKALEKGLQRFGYTRCELDIVSSVIHYAGEAYEWISIRDRGVYPTYMLPYRLMLDRDGAIIIFHEHCEMCSVKQHYVHSCEFLQAMIPIIGRLDAQATLEPGEAGKVGPRLRIFL